MVRVVGVRFKKAGKVYYFDPAEFPVAAGARVVVETARGVEYGEVAVGPKDVEEEQVVQPLKKVLRIGNEKDAIVAAENKRKENEAFGIAQKKIEGHTLDMNLVDVEYTFDGSKIIFYFTAEGRIDFRELVRDLAGVFRTRIEMRQIGVRDEAKLLGGIGPCGRILCCTSFLGDFAPVSIRMAKDQNLSLNPSKISGLCGRLMCCLRYEQETYEAAKKDPTLAPGYVPPVLLEETVPELSELEDRPAPAIGVRRDTESGMGARIAQAVGLTERPVRREERPPVERRERPERTERPQGLPPRERTERPERPRPEGQAQGQGQRPPRSEGQPPRERQQGQRPPRPERPRPEGQAQGQRPPRPEGQRQDKPQGAQGQQQPRDRQQGQRPPRPEGQRQQGQGGQRPPRPEGQRPPRPPQAEGQAPQQGAGDEQQAHRHRHRGHRRRGGGAGGPGGQAPQGGGDSQE
jgi:cell fate regulator YaaT (PSP1 superfamily)